jgi:hypothetical protein
MKTKKQEILENGMDPEKQKTENKKVKATKKKRKKKVSKKIRQKRVTETKDENMEYPEKETDITVENEVKPEPEIETEQAVAINPDSTINRQVLMLVAKERGIKNFRVLNKAELTQVLSDTATPEQINKIVAGSVARWKNGWGRKKNKIEQESINNI